MSAQSLGTCSLSNSTVGIRGFVQDGLILVTSHSVTIRLNQSRSLSHNQLRCLLLRIQPLSRYLSLLCPIPILLLSRPPHPPTRPPSRPPTRRLLRHRRSLCNLQVEPFSKGPLAQTLSFIKAF